MLNINNPLIFYFLIIDICSHKNKYMTKNKNNIIMVANLLSKSRIVVIVLS